MPMTKVFRNRTTGEITIVTFGWDEICNRATGPMIRMSETEFLERGVDEVDQQFRDYFTRDASIDSELYNCMPEKDREVFLNSNDASTISLDSDRSIVKIYAGKPLDYVDEVSYPLQSPDFQNILIYILKSSG